MSVRGKPRDAFVHAGKRERGRATSEGWCANPRWRVPWTAHAVARPARARDRRRRQRRGGRPGAVLGHQPAGRPRRADRRRVLRRVRRRARGARALAGSTASAVCGPSLLAADDAIRAQSLHSLAGSAVALLLVACSGLFAALAASDVAVLRWTMPPLAVVAFALSLRACRDIGQHPWRVNRRRSAAAA
jgi:hypothetical protein